MLSVLQNDYDQAGNKSPSWGGFVFGFYISNGRLKEKKTSGDILWKVSPPIKHLLKCVLHLRSRASKCGFVFHPPVLLRSLTNNLLLITQSWLIFNCMQKWRRGLIRGAWGESLVIRPGFGCMCSVWAMCCLRSVVNLNFSISFSGSWAFLPPESNH